METIVISDTNVFIDLRNIGLLTQFLQCGISIHTTSLVIDELTDDSLLHDIVSASVVVKEYDIEALQHLMDFQETLVEKRNLSFTDCSVLQYAQEENLPLITSDRRLRSTSEHLRVRTYGVLYIIQSLIDLGVITQKIAIQSLEELMRTNPRAPKKDINEMVERLKILS